MKKLEIKTKGKYTVDSGTLAIIDVAYLKNLNINVPENPLYDIVNLNEGLYQIKVKHESYFGEKSLKFNMEVSNQVFIGDPCYLDYTNVEWESILKLTLKGFHLEIGGDGDFQVETIFQKNN